MPKQKTHKGVKKRFRVTAKGKVKHRQAGTSHLAVRKTHKRKRLAAWNDHLEGRVHETDFDRTGWQQLLTARNKPRFTRATSG